MIGSINGYEWLILLVVALVLIGPERLPSYAAQLGRVVRELRRMARGANDRLREEMGDEIDELRAFDPRQYDPRRIIRDALSEDDAAGPRGSGRAGAAFGGGSAASGGGAGATKPHSAGGPVPFDDEAT